MCDKARPFKELARSSPVRSRCDGMLLCISADILALLMMTSSHSNIPRRQPARRFTQTFTGTMHRLNSSSPNASDPHRACLQRQCQHLSVNTLDPTRTNSGPSCTPVPSCMCSRALVGCTTCLTGRVGCTTCPTARREGWGAPVKTSATSCVDKTSATISALLTAACLVTVAPLILC